MEVSVVAYSLDLEAFASQTVPTWASGSSTCSAGCFGVAVDALVADFPGET